MVGSFIIRVFEVMFDYVFGNFIGVNFVGSSVGWVDVEGVSGSCDDGGG